jgi:hypothetical protein
MPATINEIVIAGPALFAAAPPVIENNPAPITAPIPNAISDHGPKVFFNHLSLSEASAKSTFSGFLINKLISGNYNLE